MYTAIIVEPREHRALSYVLNNFLSNLSDEWNIIVFHGNKNIEFLKNIINADLPQFQPRISTVNLGLDNLTIPQYNSLFMNSTFLYDHIPTETFLVFQTDTVIFEKHKHLINNFLNYDYVGAPFNTNTAFHIQKGVWVGNGGLSLRKKSKMLEIMKREPIENIAEDFYFALPKTVIMNKPSVEEAMFFSVEAIFNEASFGCHQIWINDRCQELCEMYPEAKELCRLNQIQFSDKPKLDIAIIYKSRIPFYKEHCDSMKKTNIQEHNTDCFLFLDEEYNEDVDGFKENSIYTTTTVVTTTVMKDKSLLSQIFEKKYDMIIQMETTLQFETPLLLNLINTYVNNTDAFCFNDDKTLLIGSHKNMIKYLENPDEPIKKKGIEFPYTVKPITNERYNVLYGFRGFSEICDSYKYTSEHDEAGNYYISMDKINDYDTVYMTNLSLRRLHKEVIKIQKPFILVSGGGDCECPNEMFDTSEDFQEFVNCENIKHWFCQNSLTNHPKITRIPLGLDYETMMYYTHIRPDRGPQKTPLEQEQYIMDLRHNMIPFWKRIPVCYANFQYLLTTKYGDDRREAIQKIPANLIYYDSKQLREIAFKNQTAFAFVVSPFGQDYECIRTWEALCLGCIPIVRTSPLDSLYEDLPVLIIKEWNCLTPEFLEHTIETYKKKHENCEFKYEKLTKQYWAKMLRDRVIIEKTRSK
jgi:hypothetical protein